MKRFIRDLKSNPIPYSVDRFVDLNFPDFKHLTDVLVRSGILQTCYVGDDSFAKIFDIELSNAIL